MNKILTGLLAALLLSNAGLLAEESKTPTWKEKWTADMFEQVDINHDGFINKVEAQKLKDSGCRSDVVIPFPKLDKDHDNKISRKEFSDAIRNDRKLHFYADDHDSDLGMPYRPKQGRESTQDVGLRFKF